MNIFLAFYNSKDQESRKNTAAVPGCLRHCEANTLSDSPASWYAK